MNSRALSQIGRSRSLNLEISIYSYSSYNSQFGAYKFHVIQYNTFIVMMVVMVMRIIIRMVMVMRACLVAEMASSLISLSLPQLHLAPPFQYVSVGHNGLGKGQNFRLSSLQVTKIICNNVLWFEAI